MRKRCELCKSTATILCDSDQAGLCWDCDAKVHSANFLVAKHSRTLLCHVCQSPTPWNASGYELCKTVSVCRACLDGCKPVVESEADAVEIDIEDGECDELYDQDDEDEVDRDDDDDDEVVEEEEEEGENQVVPRSASLASSEEESSSVMRSCNGDDGAVSLKLLREKSVTGDLHSNDDLRPRSSSRRENSSLPPASLTKRQKTGFTSCAD
ncbi:zinc finger protein CONSTANS-LIKE 2-like [Rhododendron vialii]|uniref:zinc finger protein CONSTANS-LIKE 2-like n=1 Tax=Rhododendron vialii TaxID=182163 RepID=UPI00265F08AA|nr:zinc finger protein CONSTANS-LIKE 2-like [Rhododendron vialii]